MTMTATVQPRLPLGRKHVLALPERIKIYEFLKTILKPNNDGTWAYDHPWSDDLVADKFDCTTSNVQSVRTEMFGKLYASRMSEKKTLEDRFNRMQKRFVELEEWCISAGFKRAE